ncbi:Ribosomal-protein-alanine acetyltransferase [Candidatus Erwinia haradaeae]|uniref:Ribosomal-protein-alanine acetyltransferase, partial n=1 Tax=Candidatus Erwinia haradaeae TaxID=1922217 RepID=A0A451D2F3_9GAMM|nr:Ribosomal-protein-alanine acetyltransferase [Candidatus Erwinia haradaeae]
MNQIVLLSPQNFNAAFNIEKRSHVFPCKKKTFFSNQGPKYLNFCFMSNEVMIAFSITQLIINEASLFNLAVDPKFQRKGFGRELINYLVNVLRNRGFHTL